jgi:hypothetical protein
MLTDEANDEVIDRIMLEVTRRYPSFEISELTADGPGDRPKQIGLTAGGEIATIPNVGAAAWLALRGVILTEHSIRGERAATDLALRLVAPYILADRHRRDPRAVNEALKALHEPALRKCR